MRWKTEEEIAELFGDELHCSCERCSSQRPGYVPIADWGRHPHETIARVNVADLQALADFYLPAAVAADLRVAQGVTAWFSRLNVLLEQLNAELTAPRRPDPNVKPLPLTMSIEVKATESFKRDHESICDQMLRAARQHLPGK